MARRDSSSMPTPIQPDDLDRITGGMTDSVTLFKVECIRCGDISGTLPELPGTYLCPVCGNSDPQKLWHYVYVHGEWIKVEP